MSVTRMEEALTIVPTVRSRKPVRGRRNVSRSSFTGSNRAS